MNLMAGSEVVKGTKGGDLDHRADLTAQSEIRPLL